MKKEKGEITKAIVILYGMCAVIRTLRAVGDIVRHSYADRPVLSAMNLICTLVWVAAFVVLLIRYRSRKEK